MCRLLHMYRRFEKISVFILGRLYLDWLTVTMKALKFFETSKNIYPVTLPNITEDFNLHYYYYYYYYHHHHHQLLTEEKWILPYHHHHHHHSHWRPLSKYTGCPRRNVPDFGRVFLTLKYNDITQNTYNPKLNGYGDNGQRSMKLWQLLHTYWLPNTY